MLRKKWIDCTCSGADHTLRFMFFDDNNKDSRDHDLYIDVYLVKSKWYKRIWRGIKYVFGYRSKYGEFTEIIYDVEKVKELKAFLDEYLSYFPETKEEKNPWFWHEEPPGAPVFNSIEDLKKNKPTTALIENSSVIIYHMLLGYVKAIIKRDGSTWLAEDEGNLYNLHFCEKRECYVSSMAMNKKAIKIVEKSIKKRP